MQGKEKEKELTQTIEQDGNVNNQVDNQKNDGNLDNNLGQENNSNLGSDSIQKIEEMREKIENEQINNLNSQDSENIENAQNNAGKSTKTAGNPQKSASKRLNQERAAFEELDARLMEESKQEFNTFIFKGFNDDEIFVRIWDKVQNPKGVILFTHGMVEHGQRYNDFGKFLNSRGYILVLPDLRGHGKTAGAPERVGQYDGDMFKDIVRDNIKLADELIMRYNLPLIAMGHSYGSFITQDFIQNYHNHSAVVLIGSSCFKGKLDHKLGKLVADITALFCGREAKAKMIYKMTFGAYAKGLEDGNWLTHDKKIFADYQADPYCGNVCSAQFYRSFFSALSNLYTSAGLNMIDKDTPILITSGAQDPVGGKNHKDLDKLAPLYQKSGIKDVTYKLWQNGYHEILNETFRTQVYDYIANWLDEKLERD